MKGYYWFGFFPMYTTLNLATMHEMLHNYHCYTDSTAHTPVTGRIMSNNWSAYYMHVILE